MKPDSVLILSRLAILAGLSACTSNGTLFDDLDVRTGDRQPVAVDEPTMSSEPEAPPEPGAAPEPDAVIDEGVGDEGLSFIGNVPSRVRPAPSPTVPEVPAAPEGPEILSVTPPNGAVGVTDDTNIVIRFSEPMDQEATEAAYQSESIPSDSVSFIWNDDGTELTIVPDEPLEYPVGSDPALVEARRVSFFLSATATDAKGRRLAQPYESSFTLLRQIELTIFAVQDRDLSGSFSSNDTYGTGQCSRAQINMCVGDLRVGRQNAQYKGFISFELIPLPEGALDPSAVLSLEITAVSGNPFAGLGGLVLEHTTFDSIDLDAFGADALDELGLIADRGAAGTVVSADVSEAFLADRLERGVTQYRLRFEDATDADVTSDTLISAWDTQTLDVSYLLP